MNMSEDVYKCRSTLLLRTVVVVYSLCAETIGSPARLMLVKVPYSV